MGTDTSHRVPLGKTVRHLTAHRTVRRPAGRLLLLVALALALAGCGATKKVMPPASVVRTMMVAGYGGDGATACAQLGPALIRTISRGTGLSGCAQLAVSEASPKHKEEAAAATLKATISGDFAGVAISSPDPGIGDPFEGSSLVHLVRTNAAWKVICLGYCNGRTP